MRMLARITALMASLWLAGCGFTPLYEAGGSADDMRAKLSGIEVAPIADRLGQVMHNQLVQRLNSDGNAEYQLVVTLDQSTEGYGFRPDAAATQEQMTITAHVALVSLVDDKTLFADDMRVRTSYDLVLSDFATVTQREDSARRLVLDLAERIHRRLALYFSKTG
ncbi:MAG: hypothetical protein EP335_06335 [Alphaproteobacteria bacterium]|nr:MAG: hypothetical protein EP335_06335 [Alphaproteobacteria bacterium]